MNARLANYPYRNGGRQPARKPPAGRPAGGEIKPLSFVMLAVFMALHAGLGLAMKSSSQLATAHALLTLVVGGIWVYRSRDPLTAGYVAAYIATSEVVWRASKAGVFWEFGKYAMVLVLLLGILKNRRWRGTILPVVYFLLLLPALLVTLTLSGESFKNLVSFNLSGPLALMIASVYFCGVHLDSRKLTRLLGTMLISLTALSAIMLFSTISAGDIDFSGNARNVNFKTSGGYGPNQVSTTLALGVVMVFFLLIHPATPKKFRLPLLGVFLLWAGQSALTFSRSGLYTAGAALLAALCFLATDRRIVGRLIGISLVAAAAIVLVGMPFLVKYTGGAIEERFTSMGTTGRSEILMADFKIFLANPVLGVGVGRGDAARAQYYGSAVASHVEFGRMLSEHGIFGLAALVLLLTMPVLRLLTADSALAKAWVAACTVWAFMFMASTGMRLALPGLVYGLIHATLRTKLPELKRRLVPQRQMRPLPLAPPHHGLIRPANRDFAPGNATPKISRLT